MVHGLVVAVEYAFFTTKAIYYTYGVRVSLSSSQHHMSAQHCGRIKARPDHMHIGQIRLIRAAA